MIDLTSFYRDIRNFTYFFDHKFITDHKNEEINYSLAPSSEDYVNDILTFQVYAWTRRIPIHKFLTFSIFEETITVLETGFVAYSNVEFHDYLESLKQDKNFNHKIQNLVTILEHDK